MLREFTLTNFKAFAAEQRIPLRPITLVFGANSSGKSSVLHSLLLARHALDTGDWDAKRTAIGGDSVDLGGFQQYAHRHDVTKPVSFTFHLALTASFKPQQAQLLAHAKELAITLNVGTPASRFGEARGKPRLESYELTVDGERLFLMTRKASGQLTFTLWETEHPVSQRLLEACLSLTPRQNVREEDKQVFGESIDEVLFGLDIIESGGVPREVEDPVGMTEGQLGSMLLDKSGEVKDALRRAMHLFFPRALNDLLREVHQQLTSQVGSIDYLGPLRSYPSRHLAESEHNDPNWHAGGGFAWQTVMENEPVRGKVNEWLGQDVLKSRYRLEVRKLADEETIRRRLERSISTHDGALIQRVIVREEKGDSLADEIDLSSLNADAYLEANPDLYENLVEQAKDNLEGCGFLDDYEDEDESSQQDLLLGAAEDFVSNEADGCYWDQIRDHYLENHPELSTISASLSDPAQSADWMTREISNDPSVTRAELALVDLRTNTSVSHRDVGIGISQVLPVLVHAYASRNKLIAIEQPEIHLHPALQAELGDLFIESALGENGNQFILETHSEHLILRLLRRVRETTEGELEKGKRGLKPDQISVLFVEPTEQGSRVTPLPVTPDGDFGVPWPGGFFAERTRELF